MYTRQFYLNNKIKAIFSVIQSIYKLPGIVCICNILKGTL